MKRESTETEAKSEKEVRRWLLVARASLTTMTAMRTRVSTRTQPRRGGKFKNSKMRPCSFNSGIFRLVDSGSDMTTDKIIQRIIDHR